MEVVSKEVKTDTTTVLTCMVKGVTKPFTFAWVDAVSFFCISILGCVAYRNAGRDLVLNASFELFEATDPNSNTNIQLIPDYFNFMLTFS